ncbi:endonuclease domain-containing protein [Sphingomonas oligophenolica]|uniref:DUF559 domain-containing protein n=1 Tax=Sphingomonas oligophenolica TaxID=301154 RepID=A0A502CTC8_9SPHN|nr:DUF559 domain-containing protein [Sphingomonas oligophenolica]TPG15770.1 DUF559 domain-containing protein [Sphingomonas oligophenolica]
MLSASAITVQRARALRRTMTLPEILLWQALRQHPGGHKFRKQHLAGELVLDFFCAEAKLCIEVDGEAHDRGDQPAFDADRDAWLRLHAIDTLRITAADVLTNLDGVIVHIVEAARARLPHHHPALPDGPPSRSGEVLLRKCP